ncbi:polysaccharide lyase family 7 protein [Thalassotalea sp. 1_MG-2023]|uniref:polysaccharide lyase family 7 protein n=1 Tax=Thalassotalea sp. 1_MG-2023 TaxID=3062680 RepID=UPI0026E12A3F|nr:polysaccharide lyase family 7 protein [Thalassotalea sp. 1_MG-2023]MDO6427580.1 polysaccharide lyase family 7 protein [Thalassotalea sp. 1_MG-2023]
MIKAVTKISLILLLAGCASTSNNPANKFDLSHWKITIPLDQDNDGKADTIDTKALQHYQHTDFFYLDQFGHLVFTSPNKAVTTQTSSNTRSELRQMIRGFDTSIDTKSYGNNFALSAHPDAKYFDQLGGKLSASLKVNHVAKNAKHPKKPAYSVVVGQIHAGKDKALIAEGNGFGWGNEPIKIYYKKWPNHQSGSVFWTYERNLAKDNPDRTDIAYPVWGNTWENTEDPKSEGIKLNEEFSYEINVFNSVMHLTFTQKNQKTVTYQIDLSNNIDAYGNIDNKDNPNGYTGDWHYFKAGAYNQCSTKDADGIWYAGCSGTGDWKTDKANGDYTRVTFTNLTLSQATQP